MRLFPCPVLGVEVELTDDREQHIAERHPELLPLHLDWIAGVLADPDVVRGSVRVQSARLFSRWYAEIRGGKHVVVVVIPAGQHQRARVITAYLARRLGEGMVEWKKN